MSHAKTGWRPITPTWTNLDSRQTTLSDGSIQTWYRSGIHVVVTQMSYQQQGKRVDVSSKFKRLSILQSFLYITKLRRRNLGNA